MNDLENRLYEFLRDGDAKSPEPEDFGLDLELGSEEHTYLATVIAAWLERNFTIEPK